jgi:hypothetical protein
MKRPRHFQGASMPASSFSDESKPSLDKDRSGAGRVYSVWRWWRNVLHPERYHGIPRKGAFSEGWYYKLVSAGKERIVAVVPGVHCDRERDKCHAFIQIMDGSARRSRYFRFPFHDFHAKDKPFSIQIGANRFDLNRLRLSLEDPQYSLRGTVTWSGPVPWPVSPISPGAMGWNAYIPATRFSQGVLSMDHTLSGHLIENGKNVIFTGGRGYIGKDWGREYPTAYLWMQCNHFKDTPVSFMGSVARIPPRGNAFRGFLAAFLFRDRFIPLTSYSGASLETCLVRSDRIVLEIRDHSRHQLQVTVTRGSGNRLKAFSGKEMVLSAQESLDSRMTIRWYRFQRGGRSLVWEGEGYPAAVDVKGEDCFISGPA